MPDASQFIKGAHHQHVREAAHLSDEADAHVSFVRRLQGQHEDVLRIERQEHALRRTITAPPRAADLWRMTLAVRRKANHHRRGRQPREDSRMLMPPTRKRTCMPAW